MSNTIIQLRHSYVTGNVPSSLANGEIAINTYDGKLFYRGGASNTIQTIEKYEGPAGLDGEIQFNDSGVLGSDSGLTYNKTTDVITIVGGAIVGGINVAPRIEAAFLAANTPSHVANSAASYANAAFTKANTAGVAANTPSHVANSAASYANSAFLRANTPTHVANSAASYANSAFARANNSLDANNGGTVTGTVTATSFITSGSFGNITGANTIYANNFIANTGFIQFSDGTRQYTANAGSGGGGETIDTYARNTANLAFNHANSAYIQANTSSGGTSNNFLYYHFPLGNYGYINDSFIGGLGGENIGSYYDMRVDPIPTRGGGSIILDMGTLV